MPYEDMRQRARFAVLAFPIVGLLASCYYTRPRAYSFPADGFGPPAIGEYRFDIRYDTSHASAPRTVGDFVRSIGAVDSGRTNSMWHVSGRLTITTDYQRSTLVVDSGLANSKCVLRRDSDDVRLEFLCIDNDIHRLGIALEVNRHDPVRYSTWVANRDMHLSRLDCGDAPATCSDHLGDGPLVVTAIGGGGR